MIISYFDEKTKGKGTQVVIAGAGSVVSPVTAECFEKDRSQPRCGDNSENHDPKGFSISVFAVMHH